MRASGLLVGLSLPVAVGLSAHAKPTPPHGSAPSSRAEPRPPQPLPMLPSVSRVRVEAARDKVIVIEELNLPRGDWRWGGLDPFVAFGFPGPPIAVDAHLVAAPPDSSEVRPDDPGDALTVEPAVRRAPGAQLLLGRPQMAGVVVHIRDSDLRRAYATSGLAALRLRSLLPPAAADSRGARDVVVRLGSAGDLPLTLLRVQLASAEARPWITYAQATLCGPEADERPLSLTLIPKGSGPPPEVDAGTDAPIAPVMSVRHASDDLCIRWWALP